MENLTPMPKLEQQPKQQGIDTPIDNALGTSLSKNMSKLTGLDLLILQPGSYLPRANPIYLLSPTLEQLTPYLGSPRMVAVDFETTGTNLADPATLIIGVGIAYEGVLLYVDLSKDADPRVKPHLLGWLIKQSLTSFNVMFDGAVLLRETGSWASWKLCSYAAYKHLSTEGFLAQRWDLESAEVSLLSWPEPHKGEMSAWLKEHGHRSGEVWKAPQSLIAKYCALDVEAHWQLYHYFTDLVEKHWDVWGELYVGYHKEFLQLVKLLAEQYLRGLTVDTVQLRSYYLELSGRIEQAKQEFLAQPEVAAWVRQERKHSVKEHLQHRPTKYTKQKQISQSWLKWKQKLADLALGEVVNTNSKQQLERLFYDYMGCEVKKTTETGHRSVDKKVLPSMGMPGKLLSKYNSLVKESGYVESYLDKIHSTTLHAPWKAPGTLTGRLAGGGSDVNLQQLSKIRSLLECFKARNGYNLVQMDTQALEPMILTELSGDSSLKKLYGSDVVNDIYLWIASQISGFNTDVLQYYDPNHPTPESIAECKLKCAKIRDICKTVTLASQYGAGVKKIHETLQLAGVAITQDEVYHFHCEYWRIFSGVKRYSKQLEYEWRNRGGWVLNGRGRPLTVCEDLVKDLVNRVVQSTGHDFLISLVGELARQVQKHNLRAYPWIVDFHDETIWECRTEDAEQMAEIMRSSLQMVNQTWELKYPIKGIPRIVDNLAEIKCK